IDIRFPNCFFTNATASDYLKLLRINKGISGEEMAEMLNVEVDVFEDLEENITYNSPIMNQYSKPIGSALGVGDFKDWLLFVFTETPNQTFVDSFDSNNVLTEIKVTVPYIDKKYDKEGNVYFQKYTEEQLHQNLRRLENILSDGRLLTYYDRILTTNDKKRILQMVDILLDK
ncbi:hypothetical protein J4G37_43660, partial [Microvirga sp. 3-52]|nr:hypothetical protein [Microvirga sp. 3-52]